MADAQKKPQPRNTSGSQTTDDPSIPSYGLWSLLKTRWIVVLVVLVVLIAAGVAAYLLYTHRKESGQADVQCVIRLTIASKLGTQTLKLTPQDNSLSQANFDSGTEIRSIQIEGCGGRQ